MSSNYLHKMNPRNSLFGRIFVWFWVALIIMITLTFLVTKYFSSTWEVSAVNNEQLARAEQLINNIENIATRRDFDIKRTLNRASVRGRHLLLAFNTQTKRTELSFPPLLLTHKKKFLALNSARTPFLIRTNNIEFVGPFKLNIKNEDYYIYIGRLLRREQRPIYAFGFAFATFVLLGSLACLGIAWTITSPIKQLSVFSRLLAKGQSPLAHDDLAHRKDELGHLHHDIQNMADNLAKSVVQQKALMANISHELRTPLTRMQLALAMLDYDNEGQKNYVGRIEKDISIMDTLIGQSLQLARMNDENQADWMRFEQCDLLSLLKPLVDDLEFEAQAKNIQLSVNQYPDTRLMLIKASFLSAIENVTRNAIKYAQTKVAMNIDLRLNDENKQVLCLSIEDDGTGLLPSQIENMFEPFYRAPNGQKQEGTGLGLAIVKAAVDLHKGSIEVLVSELGGLNVCLCFATNESTSSENMPPNKENS